MQRRRSQSELPARWLCSRRRSRPRRQPSSHHPCRHREQVERTSAALPRSSFRQRLQVRLRSQATAPRHPARQRARRQVSGSEVAVRASRRMPQSRATHPPLLSCPRQSPHCAPSMRARPTLRMLRSVSDERAVVSGATRCRCDRLSIGRAHDTGVGRGWRPGRDVRCRACCRSCRRSCFRPTSRLSLSVPVPPLLAIFL